MKARWPIFWAWAVSILAQDISVTIYTQNQAVVRDVRKVEISKGISTISFKDVAAFLDPTSVHLKSLTEPEKLRLLEQNFEYDLVNPQTILNKYIDREIRILTKTNETYAGRLLSTGGNIVIEDKNTGGIKIIQQDAIQHFDFPKLPEGLITRPTLVWLVENQGPLSHEVELSYITSNMNWHAEYVGVVSPDEKSIDLSGWVSIDNRSGISYPNAKLKLVAGDIHLLQPKMLPMEKETRALTSQTVAPEFEEKSFFEYHLYTLQRRTTLQNHQTKQISLFSPTYTSGEKKYYFESNEKKVKVYMEFKNSKKDGLGLPLPKGKVRIYKKDTDNALEFIGEDAIDHTPVDEKVKLFLGYAFDLAAERIEKESKKLDDRVLQKTIEIRFRSHKKETVQITTQERFWGDWKIQSTTHPHVKKDAYTAEFTVDIPQDKEIVLTYTYIIKL